MKEYVVYCPETNTLNTITIRDLCDEGLKEMLKYNATVWYIGEL